jgi:DCN1-like protein 1/2
VYNGGAEGGAGRGFGGLIAKGGGDRGGGVRIGDGCSTAFGGGFGPSPGLSSGAGAQGQGAYPAATPLHQPAVGCKRRLSAVLELDGLADQLQRQARVCTPPIPTAGGGVLTPSHSNHPQQQHPATGSPSRKYARLGEGAPTRGEGMFS